MNGFTLYFWLSFLFSFYVCLRIPSNLSTLDNVIGSLIVSVFGFAMWPFMIVALWRIERCARK